VSLSFPNARRLDGERGLQPAGPLPSSVVADSHNTMGSLVLFLDAFKPRLLEANDYNSKAFGLCGRAEQSHVHAKVRNWKAKERNDEVYLWLSCHFSA